jgi:hypothetical protein
LREYFFEVGTLFKKWIIKKGAIDEIKEKISKCTISFSRHECLDLPPLMETTYMIQPAAEQKSLLKEIDVLIEEEASKMEISYDGISSEKDSELEESSLSVILGWYMKQRMICSGFLEYEGEQGKETIYLGKNPKIDYLEYYLENDFPAGSRIIIWTFFRTSMKLVVDFLSKKKLSFRNIGGGTPIKKQEDILSDFKEGHFDILVASYGTISEGQNIAYSNYSMEYEPIYDYGKIYQSRGRNYRAGSEVHASVHAGKFLIDIPNSIELKMLANLNAKGNIQSFLQGELKKHSKNI